MKKTLLTLLIFTLIFVCTDLSFSNSVNIDADAYILIDANSGQILYEKNSHQQVYPASTTKVMTAILALESSSLDTIMTASMEAVFDIGPGGMHVGTMIGEEYRLEDLLNALLIRSGNETANIIAENVSSSREEFIDLMNQRAIELGALSTNFTNPSGLDTDIRYVNHLSTAYDMAVITKHAMKFPEFRDIVRRPLYTLPPTNKHQDERILYSTNRMLRFSTYNSEHYSEVTGVKTGYTNRAGFNLVSSAINDDGLELISVILGVRTHNPDDIYAFSKQLLEYGFKNYHMLEILTKDEIIKSIPVENSAEETLLSLVTSHSVEYLLPKTLNASDIQRTITIEPHIEAPLEKDTVLGYMELTHNGVLIDKVSLLSAFPVEKKALTMTNVLFANAQAIKPIAIYGVTLLVLIKSRKRIARTLRKILRAILKALIKRSNYKRVRRRTISHRQTSRHNRIGSWRF